MTICGNQLFRVAEAKIGRLQVAASWDASVSVAAKMGFAGVGTLVAWFTMPFVRFVMIVHCMVTCIAWCRLLAAGSYVIATELAR